jgi:hypothetical protein
MDKSYLSLDISEPCELDLTENELFVKVGYSINKEETILTLVVDGEKFQYKEWETD